MNVSKLIYLEFPSWKPKVWKGIYENDPDISMEISTEIIKQSLRRIHNHRLWTTVLPTTEKAIRL